MAGPRHACEPTYPRPVYMLTAPAWGCLTSFAALRGCQRECFWQALSDRSG